jgi:hypothetical protein
MRSSDAVAVDALPGAGTAAVAGPGRSAGGGVDTDGSEGAVGAGFETISGFGASGFEVGADGDVLTVGGTGFETAGWDAGGGGSLATWDRGTSGGSSGVTGAEVGAERCARPLAERESIGGVGVRGLGCGFATEAGGSEESGGAAVDELENSGCGISGDPSRCA